MTYSIKIKNNVLSLSGQLTKQTIEYDLFKTESQFSQTTPLTIDLGKVTDVDSAGLAWLINIMRDCRSTDIQLKWDNVPSNIMQLAKLSNAQSLFTN